MACLSITSQRDVLLNLKPGTWVQPALFPGLPTHYLMSEWPSSPSNSCPLSTLSLQEVLLLQADFSDALNWSGRSLWFSKPGLISRLHARIVAYVSLCLCRCEIWFVYCSYLTLDSFIHSYVFIHSFIQNGMFWPIEGQSSEGVKSTDTRIELLGVKNQPCPLPPCMTKLRSFSMPLVVPTS